MSRPSIKRKRPLENRPTIAHLLRQATVLLHESGIANARQEAEWLLIRVANLSRTIFYTQTASLVPTEVARKFQAMVKRRLAGEPLQYILGDTEFYGLELKVGPGVLIPRPETERLVDLALAHYPGRGTICDLCTGSGAIALALASKLPHSAEILAVDLSPDALLYARQNQEHLRIHNVTLYEGDLFAPLPLNQQFSLITANPPYVKPSHFPTLDREVRDHEPQLALTADNDGMAIIERIADLARFRLLPDGWIFCEIGSEQGPATHDLFSSLNYRNICIHQDYCDRDRILQAQIPLEL